MNREEYLRQLKKYLRRLPKSDYESAMDYFTEYFEEAGEEGEQRVIEELGTPKEAAGELLANLLKKKTEHRGKENQKNSIGNVLLICLLAVFAAPVGIPLAGCLVLLICSVWVMIGAVVVSVFAFAVSFLVIGAKFLVRGIVAVPFSIPGACMIGGIGVLCIGCGTLLIYLGVYLGKWMIGWIPRFTQRFIRKRRVK